MSANEDWTGVVEVRDADGSLVKIARRVPRKAAPTRPSRRVEATGLVAVRQKVEAALAGGCGPGRADVRELGPGVHEVLLRIAAKDGCGCAAGVRRGAIAALGRYPTAESADLLAALAADRGVEQGLRAIAVAALGEIGSPSCLALLGRLGRKDPILSLRHAAVRALGGALSPAAVGHLQQIAERERDPALKQRAHAALAAFERAHGVRVGARPAPHRERPRSTPAPTRKRGRKS